MAEMKFKFTIQPYQTEAVDSVVGVFAGQPFNDHFTYRRDVEIKRDVTNWMPSDEELYMGFANAKVQLDYGQLLDNIHRIQARNSIKLSDSLNPEGWVYAPMETLNLKPIEKAKIDCARKLFHNFSSADVVYDSVDSYQHLLDIMNKL